MKRKEFIKKMSVLSAAPFVLNGIPFNLLAGNNELKRMAASCPTDRVLVILQLHGGNDGLNTLIPISNYNMYYNARPNIAISDRGSRKYIRLDGTLPDSAQVGLHPDMIGLKSLYDEGKVAIIQGVSYENHNQSHFRSRDIIFMGGGANDYMSSGWVGRALKDKYLPLLYPQDFPNSNMLDPLALEFGNEVSLVFHQGDSISTSISINDPISFFELVDRLEGFDDVEGIDPRGIPPASLDNSPYGKELNWILSLEQKTDEYDNRLKDVYNTGKANAPGITYPTTYPFNAPPRFLKNALSAQLQIIANLIHGGCQTKVYLVRVGGFDTHAQQVEPYDASMGTHAALLYHISSAMKAFQQDLAARGIEHRVLTVTTTEFGRRIHSNGSYGSDHGIGAPTFIFGKGVIPGVLGVNPDLTQENVAMQYDYRQVYATIMKEWMCADPVLVDSISGIFTGDYPGRGINLPIVNANLTSINEFINQRFHLNNCYPNPAVYATTISYYINSETLVELKILTSEGKEVMTVVNDWQGMGEHTITVDLRDLKPGNYLYQIKAGVLKDTKRFTIAR